MGRLLLLLAAASVAYGQPTDAQIRAEMTKPGVLEIRLTKKPGTRQWNSSTKVFEFVRGVEVVRSTEMPGVKLLVIGDAVYQSHPAGYKYWKFRVIENRYDGIPNPAIAEIEAILRKDPAGLYGGAANIVLAPAEPPKLATEPGWNWHTPNSVSFVMTVREKRRVNNTDVEIADQDYEIRLYRDTPNQPWQRFLGSPKGDSANRRVIEKKTYSPAEMASMKTVFQANRR